MIFYLELSSFLPHVNDGPRRKERDRLFEAGAGVVFQCRSVSGPGVGRRPRESALEGRSGGRRGGLGSEVSSDRQRFRREWLERVGAGGSDSITVGQVGYLSFFPEIWSGKRDEGWLSHCRGGKRRAAIRLEERGRHRESLIRGPRRSSGRSVYAFDACPLTRGIGTAKTTTTGSVLAQTGHPSALEVGGHPLLFPRSNHHSTKATDDSIQKGLLHPRAHKLKRQEKPGPFLTLRSRTSRTPLNQVVHRSS